MHYRNLASLALAILVAVSSTGIASAKANKNSDESQRNGQLTERLNRAILIQDDLISQVSNEIGVTRDFIRSLPQGSRVMVGYITAGSLQVRQPFTTDLEKAAKSLRVPISSVSSAPYNPYVEVLEALKRFEDGWSNANAILLVSDGLDTSRGFDSTAAGHTLDLDLSLTHIS